MKANRKFVSRRDDAVSPVIAVILMVAITVVLAATVYVWVSGFGASGAQAKTLALSSTTSGGYAVLTVVSASPNLNWNNVKITVDGVSSGTYGIWVKGASCNGFINNVAWDGSARLSSTLCTAAPGDIVRFGTSAASSSVKLNFVDRAAGSVMSTISAPSLSVWTQPGPLITQGTCVAAAPTATLATPMYTTTQDDAKLVIASFSKAAGTLAAGVTNTGGSTALTFTGAAANFAGADKTGFAATAAYDITGTVAPTVAGGTATTYCLS